MNREICVSPVRMALTLMLVISAQACPPPNQSPEAEIRWYNPYNCTGQVVGFQAYAIDHDGYIVKYKWFFPSGAYDIEEWPGAICDEPCGDFCLMGPLCWRTTCRFGFTGQFTVGLQVKDDDGAWSPMAYATIYVADVTNVEWVKYSPSSLDLVNCGLYGGKRIYPGKTSPDDTGGDIRSLVMVDVTLTAAFNGMPVYLTILDVDNPAANDTGLPADDCTLPLDCDEPEHPDFHSVGNDNRYPFWFLEGAPNPSTITKTVGGSWPHVLAFVQVSPLPSDNAVVMATTGYGDCAVMSEVLTTWRHLWIERDSMQEVADSGPEMNHVVGTTSGIHSPFNGASTWVMLGLNLILNCTELSGVNCFKFGRYEYQGNPYLTVANTSWPYPAYYEDRLQVHGQHGADEDYLLYDDDDELLLPSKVDLGPYEAEFHRICIDPNYLPDVYCQEVPFDRNLSSSDVYAGSGTWNGALDVTSDDDFWSALVVSAFQPQYKKDLDPGSEWGVSGASHASDNECVVYLETAIEAVGVGCGLGVSHTMAHELGHTGGCEDRKCEIPCIMWVEPGEPMGTSFCYKCLHEFRKHEGW